MQQNQVRMTLNWTSHMMEQRVFDRDARDSSEHRRGAETTCCQSGISIYSSHRHQHLYPVWRCKPHEPLGGTASGFSEHHLPMTWEGALGRILKKYPQYFGKNPASVQGLSSERSS